MRDDIFGNISQPCHGAKGHIEWFQQEFHFDADSIRGIHLGMFSKKGATEDLESEGTKPTATRILQIQR